MRRIAPNKRGDKFAPHESLLSQELQVCIAYAERVQRSSYSVIVIYRDSPMANFEMWLVGQGRKCWLRMTCNLGCILVVRWDNDHANQNPTRHYSPVVEP